MAKDNFLKIEGPGIDGESTDQAHQRWIEVVSYSLGLSHARALGGAASPQFTDLSVVKVLDCATPNILQHCAKGTIFSKVTLHVCRTVGTGVQHVALCIALEGVTISSHHPGGVVQGELVPSEEVSFCFNKIKLAYTPVDHMGNPLAKTERGWDLKKNAPAQ
ncbi:MAG: type VI secretion system tube protein Hcp [Planctomycetes bacterium]|nr:type VI secretion system tube protein Hcp [Planctomycetota bacterium]